MDSRKAILWLRAAAPTRQPRRIRTSALPAAAIALLLTRGAAAAVAAAAAAPPPRALVFILADDLGYNEFGFRNASRGFITPNIDALAAGGVELTSYYTNPLCSPTRSALMTGRYNHRLGTQSNVVYWDTPWSVGRNETFLPQRLASLGYPRRGMFGKWCVNPTR